MATSLLHDHLVSLERAALARWCAGDPSGFLELSAPDVVYFDPYRERRVDGLAALTALYEPLRGKIFAARFELLNPLVQQVGAAAVLTFDFASYAGTENGGHPLRWHCTEVFRRDPEEAGSAAPMGRGRTPSDPGTWRIIQTHWSYAWPPPAGYGAGA